MSTWFQSHGKPRIIFILKSCQRFHPGLASKPPDLQTTLVWIPVRWSKFSIGKKMAFSLQAATGKRMSPVVCCYCCNSSLNLLRPPLNDQPFCFMVMFCPDSGTRAARVSRLPGPAWQSKVLCFFHSILGWQAITKHPSLSLMNQKSFKVNLSWKCVSSYILKNLSK